ncbi:MAG: TetR/AcrR family transcriptional regulator [Faecalicoccus sp.]|nr:TetR/AcrR family transcriptional regulator [Faecalicoccus sp.]
MYCGSNKTALTSQEQIADALLRLMSEKPFVEISVSELCKEAGISRQTFYTLFSYRENVVLFTLSERHCCKAPAFHKEPSYLRQFSENYADYIYENRDFLALLVQNNITYLFYNSVYDSLTNCDCFISAASEKEKVYKANYIAGALTGIVKSFVRYPDTSKQSLTEIMYHLFNNSIF